jgi:hypothetical protein
MSDLSLRKNQDRPTIKQQVSPNKPVKKFRTMDERNLLLFKEQESSQVDFDQLELE